MRPLELNLRNFRSFYGDQHSFDFRDRHLVGVVGPIGAGKSTILDAIAFALYGRTPRISRGTKSLIHQRADEAAVQFRFGVDDQIWEAVRSIRRKGQSQHALYRYESDDPEADPVEKILQEGEVNDRIETLLGFDYSAFGRSVLLAQGQFADFLTARPAERDRVLRGLFGHDRIEAMRDIAKQRVSAQSHEIDLLSVRLESAEAAGERLATQSDALAAARSRAEALGAAEEQVTTLTRTIGEADNARNQAARRLDELNRLAERMPDAATSTAVTTRAAEARQARSALAKEHDEVHKAMASAEQALKSSDHEARLERIEAAGSLLARLEARHGSLESAAAQSEAGDERAAKAAAELTEAEAGVEQATAAVDSAIGALEAARADHQTAEDRLHKARHADMAATLRAGLTTGDQCPVCNQQVGELAASDVEGVAEAEKALTASRAALDAAERAGLAARGALESAQARATAAAQRVEEVTKDNARLADGLAAARAAVVEVETGLADLLGAGDPVELLAAAKAEAARAAEAVEVARRRVDEARRALDAAIAGEQEADRALGDLRTQLGALAGQLDADADVPEDDPAALAAALEDLREHWVVRSKELGEAAAVATEQYEVASADLAGLLAELEVESEFAAALAAARTQVDMLAVRVAEDENVIADSAELVKKRDDLETSVASFRRLQTDLTDAKFIRYLLDEERVILAELGSEHFQRLSSGRYRFSDKGDFAIVDLTAADALRNADSLSGGETFLASLGLALGLAEMVGRTGGRLEAFFLDEGFGTLDPEHLDLAMEGIEALVADHPNRLVVVVSHVPELRHRIEDLIQLDRHPVTGNSIVEAGAGGRD